jgi:hypothetical protein
VAESLDSTNDALYDDAVGNDKERQFMNPGLWKIVEMINGLSRNEKEFFDFGVRVLYIL